VQDDANLFAVLSQRKYPKKGDWLTMPLLEDKTHVFIVRIWLEHRESTELAPEWRGLIEHLPGSEKRYLKDLDDIAVFIGPYLAAEGIRFTILRRVKQWLRQRKRFGKN
jgi:hypothetical protein